MVTSTERDASEATAPWPKVCGLGLVAPAGAIVERWLELPQPPSSTRMIAAELTFPAE